VEQSPLRRARKRWFFILSKFGRNTVVGGGKTEKVGGEREEKEKNIIHIGNGGKTNLG